MKPHRPIDLEAFDEDFFSSKESNEESKIFTEISDEAEEKSEAAKPDDLFSSALDPDIIEALMNIKPSSENPVFHDIPEAEPEQTEIKSAEDENYGDKSEPDSDFGVTEDEALKSFPDFEFDPSKFDITEDEAPEDESIEEIKGSHKLKEHKKLAKQQLKEEKARLKAQKKLEQQVQKPFRKKKNLSFILTVLIIAGIIWSAFIAVIYMAGNTPETALNIGEYSLCYVDGNAMKSDEIKNSLILLKHEKIITSKQIVFKYNDEYRIESVLAVGNDICAVAVSQKVVPIPSSDILGDVLFKLDNIKPIYEIAHTQTITAVVGILVYFTIVIGVFALLIGKQNKKIKEYREDYQLVR